MAQTFGEFIAECQNWQYSAEAFEMYKEAAELDLAYQYYESVLFAIDNYDTLTESFFMTSNNDEIFTEAVSSANSNTSQVEQIKDLENSLSARASRLRDKIVDKAIKFLEVLYRFWNRIKAKFIRNDNIAKLITQINGTRFVKDDVERIINEAEKCLEKANFTIIGGNTGTRTLRSNEKIKLFYAKDNGLESGLVNICSNYIRAALDDTILIQTKGNTIINPEQFIELAQGLKANLEGKSDDTYKNKITDAMKNKPKSISFNVSEKSMDDVNNEIQQLIAEIKALKEPAQSNNPIDKARNGVKKIASKVASKTGILAGTQSFNYVSNLINCGQNIMSTITAISNYRTHMIAVISEIVGSYNILDMKKRPKKTNDDEVVDDAED